MTEKSRFNNYPLFITNKSGSDYSYFVCTFSKEHSKGLLFVNYKIYEKRIIFDSWNRIYNYKMELRLKKKYRNLVDENTIKIVKE